MNGLLAHASVREPALSRSTAAGQKTLLALIWIYFFFLIFEGSLRKWVFPQFSNPLLVVRDPVLLAIYVVALLAGRFPRHPFLTTLYWLSAICLAVSVLAGRSNLLVLLYGFHSDFLHLPLIFLMAEILSPQDVRKLGYAVLLLAGPTAVLMILQFLVSPDATLNRGTIGVGSQQIGAALGRIRPAAFFSYNTGAGQYLSLVTAFLVFGVLQKRFPLWLIFTGGVSLLLAVSVSGSRTTVSSTCAVVASLIVIWILKPSAMGRLPIFIVAFAVLSLLVQHISIFHQGMEVLQQRALEASENETFLGRIAYDFTMPFAQAPLIGLGLGIGTNVGSAVLTGQASFLLTEGEWGRLIIESGPILGIAFIFWRLALTVHMGQISYHAIRQGNFLPWLIFAATGLIMVMGMFGQATSLGFAVFGSGLCLAAANADPSNALPEEPVSMPIPPVPLRRGRSAYAENLHGERHS